MKFSLSLFSILAITLASQVVEGTFNCSMNVNVNSRDCPEISCGITGQYLAGQVVVFDCVDSSGGNFAPINSSVWWARDPLKNFVPVGNMMGVDGNSCDTHLGLCASLPPTSTSAPAPPPTSTSGSTSTNATKSTTSLSVSAPASSAANSLSSSAIGTSSALSTFDANNISFSSTGTSSAQGSPSATSNAPSSAGSAMRSRLKHGTSFITLLTIAVRWM
ncbi:hypothetical protein DFH09DRAFT_1354870 [Mycena vulgaris]|nr:hypothetical protein DFH09DRAFT_1354870 [Mycena vulgaris]